MCFCYQILSKDLKIYLMNTFEYNNEKLNFIKNLINAGKNINLIRLEDCEMFYKQTKKRK